MPYKLPGPCKERGCPHISERGKKYCKVHANKVADADVRYSNTIKRDKWKKELLLKSPVAREHRAFYKSRNWGRLRLLHLHRYPMCVMCRRPAKVVDHIKRMMAGGSSLDPDNLQSLCNRCHNSKRGQEAHDC